MGILRCYFFLLILQEKGTTFHVMSGRGGEEERSEGEIKEAKFNA